MSDESTTMAERYGLATTSSHLRCEEGRCDLDYLIASGMAVDSMGAALFRLRGEFDTARAEFRRVDGRHEELTSAVALAEEDAAPLLVHSGFVSPSQLLKLRPLLARLRSAREDLRSYVGSEYALLLVGLKTLSAAKREFGAFACVLATRQLFMQTDASAITISARVLDVWLDPTCHACDGRGFNGGTHRGEQKVRCGGCRGLGERRALLGDTAEEKRFARLLLESMQALLRHAEDQMRFRLRPDFVD